MWLISGRSVSDDTRRDCYRWPDSDTSQSLASVCRVYLRCSASTTCSTSECYQETLMCVCVQVQYIYSCESPTSDFRLAVRSK